MPVPEPNSPEALRAAQKVRNVFYMIAAANLVIIAIVMWPRPKLPPRDKAPPSAAIPADPVLAEMEAVHDRVLAAYHTRDAERFAEEFASTAAPKVDEEYFRTVIIAGYHEKFGELTALVSESHADPDRLVLAREYRSQKGPRAKGTLSFTRESDRLRLSRWRLEVSEAVPLSPGEKR